MVHNCANAFIYDDFHTNRSNNKIVNEVVVKAVDDCMRQLQIELCRTLSKVEQWDVVRAFNIMDNLTGGKKLPRLFQTMTMLSILNQRHTVIRAGTGSGKTIAMALAMLVRPTSVYITIAPLLALQLQHVSPINRRLLTDIVLSNDSEYCQVETFNALGIPTVALNQDTPPGERPKIMKVRILIYHLSLSNPLVGYPHQENTAYSRVPGAMLTFRV